MPEFNWEHVLAAVTLVGVRLAMLMTFAPFYSHAAVPVRVKAGLTLALTFLLFPVCAPHEAPPLTALSLVRILLGEAAAGLVLGLSVQFVFEAGQMAGQILGVQMGFGLVQLLDPQTLVDTTVLALFQQMFALLVFLQLDVHHWLLRGVAESFAYLPAGTVALHLGSAREIFRASGGLWLAGLQIAAPVLFATLLADLALGFFGKISPQLPVLLLGIAVKSWLGMAVLTTLLVFWPGFLARQFGAALELGERALHLAR
jgi:flagellar biosynthetic protein FliR